MNLTPITAQELECTTEWVECSCHFINARYSCVESPPPRMFDPILDVMNGFSRQDRFNRPAGTGPFSL